MTIQNILRLELAIALTAIPALIVFSLALALADEVFWAFAIALMAWAIMSSLCFWYICWKSRKLGIR